MWRKIKRFVKNIKRSFEISKLYWDTPDYDWSTIALLMKFQIHKTREHISKHNLIVDAPKLSRQMLTAECLLDRIMNDNYYKMAEKRYSLPCQQKYWGEHINMQQRQDSELLSLILQKHLCSWWD